MANEPIHSFQVDKLKVEVYRDRQELGSAAGHRAAEKIRAALAQQDEVRVIFAAAPSQNETLETLARADGIDWSRVVGLHMDEYIGLAPEAPQRFSRYLYDHIVKKVPFKEFLYLDDTALKMGPGEIIDRYTEILHAAPVDLVCMGIGENGHIAFNDPPVDFNEPRLVKVVDLDDVCRQQQVNDGCFPEFDAVPKQAVSLSVTALFRAKALVCSVPAATKRAAVMRTVSGDISGECPATILRRHPDAVLYVETDSFDLESQQG
ncbi:MAG: glucosamine-6-phosphate deaminase [Thermoguttaceae bacterium]|nr:glucosamine-6-phosphate deaminase [Thermoguttaceae bacterium]